MNRKLRLPRLRGLTAPFNLSVTAGLLCLPWAVCCWGPDEAVLGRVYRIFYLHLPLAWWGLFSLLSVCAADILYLRRGRGALWAEAATESGLVFMGAALLSGMLWARLSWGVWWRWEPKLFTALLLCLMYAACLLVRKRPLPLEREKKLAAALGIIAFVNVPFIFLAGSAFPGGAHPPLLLLRGDIALEMLPPLLACLLIFGLLWLRLTLHRLERARKRQRSPAESGDDD